MTANLGPTAQKCFVTEVRLQLRIKGVTDTGLPRDFEGSSPRLILVKTGKAAGSAAVTIFEGKPITGPDISLSCTGLRFGDFATASFIDAIPAYGGAYKPTAVGGMAPFSTVEPDGTWELKLDNLDGPADIVCWNVTFSTVVNDPLGTP